MAELTAERIYAMLAEQAKGRSALDAGFGVSWKARESLAERAVRLTRLAARIEQGWTGTAGGGAARGLGPITADLDAAAADHDSTQDLMNRQMNDFAAARSAVVPMPAQPRMQDPAALMASGESPSVLAATLERSAMNQQTTDYHEAARTNVEVYRSYYGASGENTTGVPQQAPNLPTSQQPPPVRLAEHPSGGLSGGPGGAPSAAGAAAGPGTAVTGSEDGAAVGTGGAASTVGAGPAPVSRPAPEYEPSGSGTSAAAAGPANPVADTGPRPGQLPGVGATGHGEQLNRSPGSGFGTGGGLSGGATGAGGSGRIADVLGGRAAPGGSGSGAGSSGSGTATGGGQGGSGQGARGGAAPGTGTGTPLRGPGQAQAAGSGPAAAAAGRGGGGGMGAMPPGAAAGRGDDDKEHKRRYGVAPTAEELCGDDEESSYTNTPVLGAIRQPGEKQQ